MRRNGGVLIAVLLVWGLVGPGQAGAHPMSLSPDRVAVTDLGTWVVPADVSDAGYVVGFLLPSLEPPALPHGFVWRRGQLTDLPPPVEGFAVAVSVNDRGQVVGNAGDPTGGGLAEAVLWWRGRATVLAPGSANEGAFNESSIEINRHGQVLMYRSSEQGSWPAVWDRGQVVDAPHSPDLPYFTPAGINDHGVVAASRGDFNLIQPVVWRPGTQPVDLGTLGGPIAQANDINDAGQVVGTSRLADGTDRMFFWDRGRMVDLGTLGGETTGPDTSEFLVTAGAINDRGQVVGFSETASGARHGFLWQDGHMTDLGTLGGEESIAEAVNNRGQVIGASQTASGTWHAFVWENGTMVDIGILADPGPSSALDINDRGQIIGFHSDPDGATRGVVWTLK